MKKNRQRLTQIEKDYFDNHFLNSLNETELTQAAVAKYIGVTRGAIVQWKSHNSYPQVGVFLKLAELFSWNLDTIDSDINKLKETIIQTDIGQEPQTFLNTPPTQNVAKTTTDIDDRYLLIKDDLSKLSDNQFMQLMLELKHMTKKDCSS